MSKQITNTEQYRKCINLQVFELPSMLRSISGTGVSKDFSGTQFHVSTVDGAENRITLFVSKLLDLILLKLTELVHYDHQKRRLDWDGKADWIVYLSVLTVAECLGVSTNTVSLVHLYDRIVDAVQILRNIRITINNRVIDGYLGDVGVRNCSRIEDYLTKSNALFCFCINPDLIEYIASQHPGFYHYNHCWLHLPEHSQNAYAAAKRLARHYSQNTHQRKNATAQVIMNIDTLWGCLPRLNSADTWENRRAFDNALKSISGTTYEYIRNGNGITFAELKKLRLQKHKYSQLGVAVRFTDHPNTSENKVTDDQIKNMNNDALYAGFDTWALEDADDVIIHKGIQRKLVVTPDSLASDEENTAVLVNDAPIEAEIEPAEGIIQLENGGVILSDGRVALPNGKIITPLSIARPPSAVPGTAAATQSDGAG